MAKQYSKETLDAFEEMRKCFGLDAIIMISTCTNEEKEQAPVCPDCGAPAHWRDCEQCQGAGLTGCICQGSGGDLICSKNCFERACRADAAAIRSSRRDGPHEMKEETRNGQQLVVFDPRVMAAFGFGSKVIYWRMQQYGTQWTDARLGDGLRFDLCRPREFNVLVLSAILRYALLLHGRDT